MKTVYCFSTEFYCDTHKRRISWIRQTIEDNTQLFYIDKNAIHKISDDALLEHVYILTINKLALPEVGLNQSKLVRPL